MKKNQSPLTELSRTELQNVNGGVPSFPSEPPVLTPIIIVESFQRIFFSDQP